MLPFLWFSMTMDLLARARVLPFTTTVNASPRLDLPPELFSPLIAQKLLATATNVTTSSTSGVPTLFPHCTTRDTGKWLYSAPEWWTSGFLPATLYAMHERVGLCQNHSAGDNGDAQTWLELGRLWAAGEAPSKTLPSVKHDVGFLSFPFAAELAV